VTRDEALAYLAEHGYVKLYAEIYGDEWSRYLVRYVPDYMVDGMVRWIVFGIEPGDFMRALVSNDLMGALRAGDDTNRRELHHYGMFFYNAAPSGSFGRGDVMQTWSGHPFDEAPTEVAV
jgi:hypothetical protein